MYRTAFMSLLVTAALAAGAWAQTSSVQHSELSVQITGVFTANANNTPTTHLATNSAGLLVGYRLHLTAWEGLEIEYGYTRNGQRYFTPATTPGAPGANYAISANMQQLIANEVITTPRLFGFLQPFILGGGGAVFFRPRGFSAIAAGNQTRGAFNYGAGLDFHIDHIGARVEYQGLIFKIPDFGNPLLAVNKWTHVAQPSVGLLLTF
ncbi:MAG: hypothetical protein ACRD1M_04835 [Terriglobales bacterium]